MRTLWMTSACCHCLGPKHYSHALGILRGNTSTTSKVLQEWFIPDLWSLKKQWNEILCFWVQAVPWLWHKQLHQGSYCYTVMWKIGHGWGLCTGMSENRGAGRVRGESIDTVLLILKFNGKRQMTGHWCLRQEEVTSVNPKFTWLWFYLGYHSVISANTNLIRC